MFNLVNTFVFCDLENMSFKPPLLTKQAQMCAEGCKGGCLKVYVTFSKSSVKNFENLEKL
jgi:hypothetical protein